MPEHSKSKSNMSTILQTYQTIHIFWYWFGALQTVWVFNRDFTMTCTLRTPLYPPWQERNQRSACLCIPSKQFLMYVNCAIPRFPQLRLPRSMWALKHSNGLRALGTQTPNELQTIGISMDVTILCWEVGTPVGGRLQLFSENWMQVSRVPWILEMIACCK